MAKTQWQKWHLTKTGYIKRFSKNNETSENYPRKKYKNLDDVAVQDLIIRLNETARIKAEEKYRVDNAFIDPEMLEMFRKSLEQSYKKPEKGTTEYNQFVKYGLHKLQTISSSPRQWKKKEQEWGALLFKTKKSKRIIKRAVELVNRFFKFANDKDGDTYPLLKFKPFETKELDRYEERRLKKINEDSGGEIDPFGFYISKKDRETMLRNSGKYKPLIRILMAWGLRYTEALALPLTKGNLYEDGIEINERLEGVGKRKNPKDAKKETTKSSRDFKKVTRVVPHWNADDLEKLIEDIDNIPYEHPTTVNRNCNRIFEELHRKEKIEKLHHLHDFRRTWITDMCEIHSKWEVRDAVGHSDIKTTESYIRPKRVKKKVLR